MERLFGRQISNLIQPNPNLKCRPLGRAPSCSFKHPSEQQPKPQTKRLNRSSVGLNVSQKMERLDISVQNYTAKDTQMVQQYFEDCFTFMLKQESSNSMFSGSMKNYMSRQPQITQKMRGILIDWLVQLHYKFKMFPQTLYIAVTILDKYLSKKMANKQNLQLIGATSLYIAAKYQQTYQVPHLDDLVHLGAKSFTKQQVIKMQAEMMEMFDFNLIFQTVYRFYQAMATYTKMQDRNFHLGQYVIELSLLSTSYLEHSSSIIAASTIYLINKIRKRTQAWPRVLEQLTGYSQKQLKSCARELCHLLEKADEMTNNRWLKKKFSQGEFHEVTRIKLERKAQ